LASSDHKVERLNKTLLKAIRIAKLQGKDWKRDVQDFLFQYHSTPHTVTSLSPAELLLGRKLREKEYADSMRHATTSDFAEGDMILLRQNQENPCCIK